MSHGAAAPPSPGTSCGRHRQAAAQGGRLTSPPVTEFAARHGKIPHQDEIPTLIATRCRDLASSGLAAPWRGPPRRHRQLWVVVQGGPPQHPNLST